MMIKRFKQFITILCSLCFVIALSGCKEEKESEPTAPSPLSLSLTGAPDGVFYYNEYHDTLYLEAAASDGSTKELVWESSNTDVAAVNDSGTVTVYEEGSVTVKAALKEDSSVCADVELTTKYSVIRVSGRPEKDTVDIQNAEGITLGYSFLDEGAAGEVVWSSSNESVLTVDGNGRVTVCGLGVSTISVYLKNNPNVRYAFELTVIDSNYANYWYESFTTASVVGTNCVGKLKISGYNLTDMRIEEESGKKALVISGNSAESNNAFITVNCSNLIAGNKYRLTVEYELVEGEHSLDVYRFDTLTTGQGESGSYSTELFADSPSWRFKISSTKKAEYKLKIKSIAFALIDADNVVGGEDIFD